ncbi:unnamed protein product [Closterium sp. NIES-65]|nr:unnamed protein product [Closterium sp. NIES-65]
MANSEDVIVPADLEDDVAGSASALRVSPWCAPWLWSAVKVVLLVLLWHTFSTALSLLKSHLCCHSWLPASPISWRDYFVRVVPTAVATSLDIALSSFSLALVTRTFYSMWRVVLPVVGETEFELLGFIFVMLASFMAGLQWVLLQVLLQPQLHSACVLCLLSHTPQSSGFSPFLAYLLWSRHPHATISFPVLLVPLASHQPQVRPPSTPTGLTNLLLTLLQYLAPVMALVCGIFSLLHEPWSSLASLPYFDTLTRNKERESEGHQVHALSDELLPHHPGAGPRTNSSCLLSRLKSHLKAIGCKSSLMSSSLTTRAGPPSNFSCCTTPPRSTRPPP